MNTLLVGTENIGYRVFAAELSPYGDTYVAAVAEYPNGDVQYVTWFAVWRDDLAKWVFAHGHYSGMIHAPGTVCDVGKVHDAYTWCLSDLRKRSGLSELSS